MEKVNKFSFGIETMRHLKKENNHDEDLGKKYRSMCNNHHKVDKLCFDNPHDATLGKILRKLI